jgi:hypothetical protein
MKLLIILTVILTLIAAFIAFILQSDADPMLLFLPFPAIGDFKNQVVWITGASSGIGASMAINLCKR